MHLPLFNWESQDFSGQIIIFHQPADSLKLRGFPFLFTTIWGVCFRSCFSVANLTRSLYTWTSLRWIITTFVPRFFPRILFIRSAPFGTSSLLELEKEGWSYGDELVLQPAVFFVWGGVCWNFLKDSKVSEFQMVRFFGPLPYWDFVRETHIPSMPMK